MTLSLLLGVIAALAVALPLALKWELGLRRSAGAVVLLGVVAGASVALWDAAAGIGSVAAAAVVCCLTLALSAATVLWRFYRDPERTSPTEPGVVVSPADGVVLYVRRFEGGVLPVSTKLGRDYDLEELVRTPLKADDALVVGIALSFLDVHISRAPIAGVVTSQRRYPGRFASLKDPAAVFENERATFVIDGPELQVAVVLIASRLVRRIVSFVRDGERLASGQRIGVIRFGSQVDLVLPDRDDVRLLVAPGERVYAGETVLATAATRAASPEPAVEAAG
jgi:phosphatidylserine decarboxylase